MASVPALLSITCTSACTVETALPNEGAQASSEAIASCPAPYAGDSNDRAAATVAYTLMKLAAAEAQASGNLLAARSILAPQRYIFLPGTSCYSWGCYSPGIQFDPADPLYSHVTSAMKAALAFAQVGSSPTDGKAMGFYLANGLWRGYAYTDGQVYPSIYAVPTLAQFQPGHTATVHLDDSNSADNSHYATISGQSWCNTFAVTISETVDKDWAFAPLEFRNVSDWRSVPGQFYGRTGGTANGQPIPDAHVPTSPFNGVDGQNPYLLVSINGVAQHWAYANYPPTNCWNNPGYKCTSSLDIDPVPYAEPGVYFGSNGAQLGMQSNPFVLAPSTLYATDDHAGQWATRVVNGVQQWGTFSQAVSLYGVTEYKYVKQY